jgi:hypothetical protein
MSIYYAGAAIKKKAFSYSTASTVAALPCSSNIPPPFFMEIQYFALHYFVTQMG